MRIAVREIVRRREQRAGRAQVAADRPVGGDELLVDDAPLPAEPRPIGPVEPRAVDREHRIDAVRLAQQEVVLAMIGRHVDEAGTLVGSDEIARQERAGLGEECQRPLPIPVIPAKAGIQTRGPRLWIPAFAGMTKKIVDWVAGDSAG